MKLGEIKLEAISLMYPSACIRYDVEDTESLNRAVFEMKSDPNLGNTMEAMVGSVNRCFARIENKDLSELKCCDISISLCERVNEKYGISLPKDCLRVAKLMAHVDKKTYLCEFEVTDSLVLTAFKGSTYTLVYRTKIPRITRACAEEYEIELPFGIEAFIPYFIKGELFSCEDREDASSSMDVFERETDSLANKDDPCNSCFQIIYSLE